MRRPTLYFCAFFFADKGFVDFDDGTGATHWGEIASSHALANAMGHKPSGLIGAEAEHTEQLMRAHALLRRGKQVRRQEPLVQRNMRTLIKRSRANSEFLAALGAMVPARS